MITKRTKSRLLSLLLSLVMLLSLLPAAALAAEPEYDSYPTHFSYYVIRYTDAPQDWYLSLEYYFGSATHVQIPETVAVSLLDSSTLNNTSKAALQAAGITALPVKRMSRIAANGSPNSVTHVRLAENITEIYGRAFDRDRAPDLEEVDIPAGSKLEWIASNAFEYSNLRRVGVSGTNALPATVNSIGTYAFSRTPNLQSIDLSRTKVTSLGNCTFVNSGVTSVSLPNTLTSLDLDAFANCRKLTAIDIPAGVSYMGGRVFENCSSLRSVTFRGSAALQSNGNYALKGLPEDCTVYMPKPTQSQYAKLMDTVYRYMSLNANAKVCWLNSSSTATKPSINNANAVTLTGTGAPSFTYDYNDSNNDGLGGILYVDGRQSGWTLNINAGSVSNETVVTWYSSAAYYNDRDGTLDGVALRGRELTDNMRRRSFINNVSNSNPSTQLSISMSDEFGVRYYFPIMINAGDINSPQRSMFGPPIAVVYRPADSVNNRPSLTLSGGGGFIPVDKTAANPQYGVLESGSSFQLSGVENMGEQGINSPLEPRVTQLSYGVGTQVSYQWEMKIGEAWSGIAGASGAAVYSGYGNTDSSGPYWLCGGIPISKLNDFRDTLPDFGSQAFRLHITGTVAGVSVETVSGVYYLDTYTPLTARPYSFDTSDMTSGELDNINLTPVNGSYAPGSRQNPITVKRGTENLYALPYYTQDKLGDFHGHFTYSWAIYPVSGGDAIARGTTEYVDLSLLPNDVQTDTDYYVGLVVSLFSEGRSNALTTFSTSTSSALHIKVQAQDAEKPWKEGGVPEALRIAFDEERQSQMQLVNAWDENRWGEDALLWVYLDHGLMSGEYGTAFTDKKTVFEVYEVDSPDQNRGGRLLFTTDKLHDLGDGIYSTKISDGSVTGEYISANMYHGELAIPLKNGNDNFYFDSYGARYVYVRATNEGLRTSTNQPVLYSVAYSPTFLILPGDGAVAAGVPKPDSRMEVVRPPEGDVWLSRDEDNDGEERVTLTAKLRLHNMPPVYSIPDGGGNFDNPLQWIMYEQSISESGNMDNAANWEQTHLPGYMTDSIFDNGSLQALSIDGVSIGEDGSYVFSVTATLQLNCFTDSRANYLFGSSTLLNDGTEGWRVALEAKPNTFADVRNGYISRQYTPVTRLRLAPGGFTPRDLSVIVAGDNAVGGKGLWDDNTESYVFTDAQANPLVPENEHWVFSEEFDFKWPGELGNDPCSGPLTFTAASVGTPKSGETFLWRVKWEGTDRVDYLTAGQSCELTPAGSTTAHQWDASYFHAGTGAVPTLTAEAPHGTSGVYRDYAITPMLVKDWDPGTKSYSAAQTGQTLTLRINRRSNVGKPYLSTRSDISLYFNTGNLGLSLPHRCYFNLSSMEGTLFYRIYRTASANHNPEVDTPVTDWLTVDPAAGSYVTRDFYLTEEALQALVGELPDGEGNVLYYVAAYNRDDGVPGKKKSDTVFLDLARVYLGSFRLLPTPVASWGYDGDATIDYVPGGTLPESLRSFTATLPWKGTETQGSTYQSISLCARVLDKDSHEPIPGQGGGTNVLSLSRNHETSTVSESPWGYGGEAQMTYSIDGSTVTVTLTELGLLQAAQLNRLPDGVGASYDVELYWEVENSEYNTGVEYATGGNVSEWRSRTITVRQRTVDPAVISTPAVDAVAQVSNLSRPHGMEGSGTVPAYVQHGNYQRPVSFTVTAAEGLYLDPYLQYWQDGEWHTANNYNYNFYDGAEHQVDYYNPLTADGTAQPLRMEAAYITNWEAEDGVIFLRVAVETSNENIYSAASSYSEPFAMTLGTGAVVDAEYPNSDDLDSSPLWRVGGKTPTTGLTIGGGFMVSSGTLSYQWSRNTGSEWVEIPGATSATYTIPQTEVQDAINAASGGLQQRLYQITVTNTDNSPHITGSRTATQTYTIYVRFARAPETPVVTLSDPSPIAMKAGETPLTLSANVSNAADCGELSYSWYAKVVDDGTGRTDYPGTLSDSSYFTLGVGGSALSWKSVGDPIWIYDYNELLGQYKSTCDRHYISPDDLWAQYTGPITLEVWCSVTNTDSSITNGIDYISGQSPRKRVTLSRPDELAEGTLAADKASLTEGEQTTLRLTGVSAANGGTLQYRWYTAPIEDFAVSSYLTATTEPEYSPAAKSRSDKSYYWVVAAECTSGGRTITERSYGPVMVRTNGTQVAIPPIIADTVVYGAPNDSVELSVITTSPDGGSISYRWEKKVDGEWQEITGETSSAISVLLPTKPGYGDRYRVTVTNTNMIDLRQAQNSAEFTIIAMGVVLEMPILPYTLEGKSYSAEATIHWYGENSPGYVEASVYSEDLSASIPGSWEWAGTGHYTGRAELSGSNIDQDIYDHLTVTVTPSDELPVGTPLTDYSPIYIYVKPVIIDQSKRMLGKYGEAIASGVRLTASNASGEASGTWTLTAGTLPAGVIFNADGSFSGTPAYPGRYPVTVSFTGGEHTAERSLELLVRSGQEESNYSFGLYSKDTSYTPNTAISQAGDGWRWDAEVGVLYLTDASLGTANIYTNTSIPFWIHVSGDNSFNAGEGFSANSRYSTFCDLHLMGDGNLSFRNEIQAYALYLYNGLTLTPAFTGTLTVEAEKGSSGEYNNHWAVYGDLVIEDGCPADVTITTRNTNKTYVHGLGGSLTHGGTGTVRITINVSAEASSIYGVGGNVTHSGSGNLIVRAVGRAGDPAVRVCAVYGGLVTSGTGDVTLWVDNADNAYGLYGYGQSVIGHTGGWLSITALGENISRAIYDGYYTPTYAVGKSAANYEITGSNASHNVIYTAADMSALSVSTTDGTAARETVPYTAIEPISFRAAGAGLFSWSMSGAPAGLTLTPSADGITATLSGAPIVAGTFEVQVMVSNATLFRTINVTVHVRSTLAELDSSGSGSYLVLSGPGGLWMPVAVEESDSPYFQVLISGMQPERYMVECSNASVLTDVSVTTVYGGVLISLRPAAGATQGQSAKITLRGFDSEETEILTEQYDMFLACASPAEASINGRNYKNLWFADSSGVGWSWNHKTGILTLTNYDGGNNIEVTRSSGAELPLHIVYDGENRAGYIYGSDSAIILEAEDSASILRATIINSNAAITLKGGNVELSSYGNYLAVAAKLVLQDVKRFTVDNSAPSGHAIYDSTLLEYQMSTSYFVQGAPDAKHFAVGTELPPLTEPEGGFAVTGPDRVTVGGSVTLTAPSGLYSLDLYDKYNEPAETAVSYTYQWYKDDILLGGFSTSPVLTVSAAAIGDVGESAELTCRVTADCGELSDSNSIITAPHTLTVTPVGVTVSGEIKSYNPGNKTTVVLKQGEEVKYSTEIAATSGSGQMTQPFSFGTVAPGTYDLVVTKAGHLTYTVTGVVVGSENVDLTAAVGKAYQTITLLTGDMDGDNTVNYIDLFALLDTSNYGLATAIASNKLADLDGDGFVNYNDLFLLLDSANYGHSSAECVTSFS